MNKHICVPGTNQRLYVGSIVILNRLPNSKFVVKNGKYTYMGKKYNGWYFSSIPYGAVVPMNRKDLTNLKILFNVPKCPEDSCAPKQAEPPKPPKGSRPSNVSRPEEEAPKFVNICLPRKYFGNTNYVEGELIYLRIGEVYQVSCDFKSSRSERSRDENFRNDMQSGYLVPVAVYIDMNDDIPDEPIEP